MLQHSVCRELPDLTSLARVVIAGDAHHPSELGSHNPLEGVRAITEMILARLYLALAEGRIDADDPRNAHRYLELALEHGRAIEDFSDKIVNAMVDWLSPKPLPARRAALDAMTHLLRGPLHANNVASTLAGELHYIQAFEAYALGRPKQALVDGIKGVMGSRRARKDRGLLSIMARSLLRPSAPPALQSHVDVSAVSHTNGTHKSSDHMSPELSPELWAEIESHLSEPVIRRQQLTNGYSGDEIYDLATASGRFILRVSPTASCMAHYSGLKLAGEAGACVPKVVACKPLPNDGPSWLLQTALPGQHFDELDFGDVPLVEQVLRDIARELHRIHQVRIHGFGRLVSPDGAAEFATQAEWANSWLIALEGWCRTGALPEDSMRSAGHALAFLMNEMSAPPTLGHGDLSGRNLLVNNGRLTGLIDWDDASGCDPVWDLANIVFSVELRCEPEVAQHFNAVLLDEYLQSQANTGSQTDNRDGQGFNQQFLRRLAAHRVIAAAWIVGTSASLGDGDPYIQHMNARATELLHAVSHDPGRVPV